MTHRIDVDSIHENVFLLLNICYAAKIFAQSQDLDMDSNSGPINKTFYFGWLKHTLTQKLIDVAIKTRILLDIISVQETHVAEIRDVSKNIVEKYNIGFFVSGDGGLSIREACNKIIHAATVVLLGERGDDEHFLDEEQDAKRDWRYWDGVVELAGSKGKTDWLLTLHVSDFCQALEELVVEVEHAIDWKSVYYDVELR